MAMDMDPPSRLENKRLQELLALGGSREFVDDLLADFSEQAPRLLDGMKKGCLSNNATQAESAAHKLMGSCRELGFGDVQHLCQQFERLCKQNDIPKASTVLVEIQTSYPRIQSEITHFLKGPSK